MSCPEVIDLTSSSPTAETLDPDCHELAPSSQSAMSQESRRKRKRKAKRSITDPTTSHSRRNSVERESDTVSQIKKTRLDRSLDRSRERDHESSGLRSQNESPEKPDIFFVDLAAAPIPSSHFIVINKSGESQETIGKLLVPSHVTILGSTPVEIIPQPLSDPEDNDFINYLDYDDAKHTLRYYDDLPSETVTLNRTVCKNCGAEGEHKTSACPVQICLTCGVRDEHSTRSCPISKVCFTCGMKGHVNANCPNRRSARALMATKETDCDRCSSSRHQTNECPTLWRLYEYFTGEEQARTLSQRQSKRDFKLGQGGEGYVADDEWCYYCGSYGHLGDDCHDHVWGQFPEEFSAFSKYNIMNGPFYDPGKESNQPTAKSRTRDWDKVDNVSGWGQHTPGYVGRQARIKSKATLERQAREVEDDPDDWFGNATKRNGAQPRESKTITFSKSLGGGQSYAPPDNANSPPSLLARLGNYQIEDPRPKRDRRDYSVKRGHRHRDERHSSDKRSYVDSGPRYRGGYAR